MKKIIPLILFSLLLALSACEVTDNTSKENILKNAANFENGVDTPLEYNNGLVSQVSLLQAAIVKLENIIFEENFDPSNADHYKGYSKAYDDFSKKCKKVKKVVSSVKPVGKQSGKYRDAAIGFINSISNLSPLYAPEVVKKAYFDTDKSWGERRDKLNQIAFQERDSYLKMNDIFCKKNNITVSGNVDINELAK